MVCMMSHSDMEKRISCYLFCSEYDEESLLGAGGAYFIWCYSSQPHPFLSVTQLDPKWVLTISFHWPGQPQGGWVFVLTVLAFGEIAEINVTWFGLFHLWIKHRLALQRRCSRPTRLLTSSSPPLSSFPSSCPICWTSFWQNSSFSLPAARVIVLSCCWAFEARRAVASPSFWTPEDWYLLKANVVSIPGLLQH